MKTPKYCYSCVLDGKKVEMYQGKEIVRCIRCGKDYAVNNEPKEVPVVKGMKNILG